MVAHFVLDVLWVFHTLVILVKGPLSLINDKKILLLAQAMSYKAVYHTFLYVPSLHTSFPVIGNPRGEHFNHGDMRYDLLSFYPLVSAVKEPGKFDLVYHNENGTEVVEYAVTQERRVGELLLKLLTDGGRGRSMKGDITAS